LPGIAVTKISYTRAASFTFCSDNQTLNHFFIKIMPLFLKGYFKIDIHLKN